MRALGCILVGICAGMLASPGGAQNARARPLLLLDRAHLARIVERRVTAIPPSKHLSPPSKKTHAQR